MKKMLKTFPNQDHWALSKKRKYQRDSSFVDTPFEKTTTNERVPYGLTIYKFSLSVPAENSGSNGVFSAQLFFVAQSRRKVW